MDFSQAELKEYFDYEDGFLIWKKLTFPRNNHTFIGKPAGYIRKPKIGYNSRILLFKGKRMAASRAIFMWHYGWLPKMVDHKDRNPLNDRIENLRAATPSENSKNKKSRTGSSSKYLGVCYNKACNYWHAAIFVNGKNKHLGSFTKEKDAARAYNEAAIKIHKEFANLNTIENDEIIQY